LKSPSNVTIPIDQKFASRIAPTLKLTLSSAAPAGAANTC
jgi:hypothetical protein